MTEGPAGWITLLAALLIGRFLSLVVDGLLEESRLGLGRSPQERAGGLLDLLPVIGWFWTKARCIRSGTNVSGLRLATEAGAVAIAVWAQTVAPDWLLIPSCALGWSLLVVTIVDIERFIIPDVLSYPLLAAGLLVASVVNPEGLNGHVVGVVVGYVGFTAVRHTYRMLRAREGLGQGDAKLLAAIGAWVSWQALPTVVLLAAALGILFSLVRSAVKGRIAASERVPFGPFLAAAGWIVWLYGPLMLVWP